MNLITHKYYVNLRLLEELERYVADKNPSMDELLCYFRRLKLYYRHGLSKIER